MQTQILSWQADMGHPCINQIPTRFAPHCVTTLMKRKKKKEKRNLKRQMNLSVIHSHNKLSTTWRQKNSLATAYQSESKREKTMCIYLRLVAKNTLKGYGSKQKTQRIKVAFELIKTAPNISNKNQIPKKSHISHILPLVRSNTYAWRTPTDIKEKGNNSLFGDVPLKSIWIKVYLNFHGI